MPTKLDPSSALQSSPRPGCANIRQPGTFALALLAAIAGCTGAGEDSWRHYVSGGHYPARTPSMSPDGAVIIFSSPQSGHGDIYRINADGSASVRLTADPSFETDPIFSPDGLTIAFAREADGCRHIWLMDRDGTNQRQLTSGSVLDDTASFTPDGAELLLNRSPVSIGMGMGRSVENIAVNLRTKEVRKCEGFPEYSPDGKTIAEWRINDSDKRYEIWIMDADGSNKRFLVAGHSPRFSPDGSTVLYSTDSYVDAGSNWKMIATDGSDDREIGRMADPVFSGDGEHIVCLSPSYQRELWKMDLDGANKSRLSAPVGYIDVLRRCRAGVILKIVTDDRVGDIYVIDTDVWTVRRVASMN
jgi:Tol biopolymer transport system component